MMQGQRCTTANEVPKFQLRLAGWNDIKRTTSAAGLSSPNLDPSSWGTRHQLV